jgi:hypothetical protein
LGYREGGISFQGWIWVGLFTARTSDPEFNSGEWVNPTQDIRTVAIPATYILGGKAGCSCKKLALGQRSIMRVHGMIFQDWIQRLIIKR